MQVSERFRQSQRTELNRLMDKVVKVTARAEKKIADIRKNLEEETTITKATIEFLKQQIGEEPAPAAETPAPEPVADPVPEQPQQ